MERRKILYLLEEKDAKVALEKFLTRISNKKWEKGRIVSWTTLIYPPLSIRFNVGKRGCGQGFVVVEVD